MALKFVGEDPDSPNGGSPTVRVEGGTAEVVIQGWLPDPQMMAKTEDRPCRHSTGRRRSSASPPSAVGLRRICHEASRDHLLHTKPRRHRHPFLDHGQAQTAHVAALLRQPPGLAVHVARIVTTADRHKGPLDSVGGKQGGYGSLFRRSALACRTGERLDALVVSYAGLQRLGREGG